MSGFHIDTLAVRPDQSNTAILAKRDLRLASCFLRSEAGHCQRQFRPGNSVHRQPRFCWSHGMRYSSTEPSHPRGGTLVWLYGFATTPTPG
ncbi:hypothetical protein BU23DRAFT_211329 [Bimuria novae-zelandiae CBS 107.79]|uniref:Uncharacterized protein n=1 Tax=Bimuria novae-zelandiae CBS 107.79 TaxID=1447943 RepID=A0A6A5V024_9PLEO|nr:hypothetical protein BU23DRAFT_211329 [Bimuria novae-zelandiae CBS 107.79]